MSDRKESPHAFDGLIWAHGVAALVMVGYVLLLGLTVALKFHWPDLMSDSAWLTWGRLRYAHTQGVFFGWLGNAFLTFLYYATPRLAGRPPTGVGLGWILFVVWNLLLVIPGWLLVQLGISQPLEWGEFPIAIDVVVIVAMVLAAIQFVLPFLHRRIADLYVSGWYIIGGLVFTLLAYPIGNFVPEFVPGARGATYSGLWIHDAVGLFVTPLALAIAYLVIPATTGKPIFSHFLSMVGFWMLFMVYPLNGTHHYVFSSIPMEAQVGAIVASVYLGANVILVVGNLLVSLRGCSRTVVSSVPLRFVWLGVISYLLVSLQGAMQALMPVNRFVHFTDWVIGHAHLAMIGFASFTAIGGLLHVWERIPSFRYQASLANAAFWVLVSGLGLMTLDLTIAGLVQGQLWESSAPFMDSVTASGPYWFIRSLSGMVLIAGFALVALSMVIGPRGEPSEVVTRDSEDSEEEEFHALAWLRGAYVITAGAGVGMFAVSFVVLGVLPNVVLKEEIQRTKPEHLPDLTASERRGREIYAREGCVNCHSQLIRFTVADVDRFGPPSEAWEEDNAVPQMWGTRRVGPDLARESGRRTPDWQLAHLWNPRFVVPQSMMPGYPWLFDGSIENPNQDAVDLVAYLESLGRNARLAGRVGPRPLSGMDPEEEKAMGMFCDCAIPRELGPAPLFTVSHLSASERERFARKGREVYLEHCGGCHGSQGRGDGPAATALLPPPRNLTSAHFSTASLSDSLWRGRPGSSMPGWHKLPSVELQALIIYVQSLEVAGDASPELKGEDLERAKSLYLRHCQQCHGARGEGPAGFATNLAPAPTRFQWIRPNRESAETTIANGVPGSAMPAWNEKLDASERSLLARYLRAFFQPGRSSGR
ncbi:hypothetical protein Pan216_36970 [Planctomycetes bacterium Pan216]|uniref:Cytochrome-c oxidase n=1 Tax=Kolteria novifilia TaxID=2527975 RepID=A0A518B786_9BACT|nr:hypothetical protein Pan216_36970 [Planctomycetes bacterium Pan216]